MIWNPLQSCGRVICRAKATEPRATIEEISSSQPESQAHVPVLSRFAQL
jgi:hypothetical protein